MYAYTYIYIYMFFDTEPPQLAASANRLELTELRISSAPSRRKSKLAQ